MSRHFRFDASRSLTALEQDSTIVAVIEMSQTKWLVAQCWGISSRPRFTLEGWELLPALDGTHHGEYSVMMRRVDRDDYVEMPPPAPLCGDWRQPLNGGPTSVLIAALGDCSDGHPDVVVLACVRLRGLAPAPLEQDGDGLYACSGWRIGLFVSNGAASRSLRQWRHGAMPRASPGQPEKALATPKKPMA